MISELSSRSQKFEYNRLCSDDDSFWTDWWCSVARATSLGLPSTIRVYNYTTVVYEEENVGRSSSNGESRRGKLFGGIIMNFETRQRVCTYSIQLFGSSSLSKGGDKKESSKKIGLCCGIIVM